MRVYLMSVNTVPVTSAAILYWPWRRCCRFLQLSKYWLIINTASASMAEFKHESMQITALQIVRVIAHYADEHGIKINKRKTSMEFALVLPFECQHQGGGSKRQRRWRSRRQFHQHLFAKNKKINTLAFHDLSNNHIKIQVSDKNNLYEDNYGRICSCHFSLTGVKNAAFV